MRTVAPDRNNFDALRLLLAAMVMLVHAGVLSGEESLQSLTRHLNSGYAVQGFFVISGYLIAMSHERSRSLKQFAAKRARRLLPAYVAVVVIMACVGVLLTSLSIGEYLLSPGLYTYLAANLLFVNFLKPSLPGVFEHNHLTSAVNGSLWSIRSELACYVATPVVAWLVGRVGRLAGIAATLAALTLLGFALLRAHGRNESPIIMLVKLSVVDCGLCFTWGIAAWHARQSLRSRWFFALGLGCCAVLAMGVSLHPWAEMAVRPALLAGAVLFLAFRLPYLGNWCRFGDLSYGTYIYHFPIIQMMVMAGWFKAWPHLSLAGTVAATLGMSLLSWRLIESPWLNRSNHYVRFASADQPAATAAQGPIT